MTRKAVITAAHCVTYDKTKNALPKNGFLVYLGLLSLSHELGSEQIRKVIFIKTLNSNQNLLYTRFQILESMMITTQIIIY